MGRTSNVRWERYPLVAQSTTGRAWLQIQANLGLATNTIEAYGRALQDYLAFSATASTETSSARGASTSPHTCAT